MIFSFWLIFSPPSSPYSPSIPIFCPPLYLPWKLYAAKILYRILQDRFILFAINCFLIYRNHIENSLNKVPYSRIRIFFSEKCINKCKVEIYKFEAGSTITSLSFKKCPSHLKKNKRMGRGELLKLHFSLTNMQYAFGVKVYGEVLYLKFYSVFSEPFIIDEILLCKRL